MDARVPARHVVIVVDDDAAVRRALAFTLDLEGFQVETFESGEALLLQSLESPIDCVVIDERLPGVAGIEALRQFRARRPTTPTILVTSHPKPMLRAAAAEAGIPILEKPLTGETLVAAIREAIKRAPPSRS
ncbi:MAG: response regulator [Phenylobacterium sp.]|nr:response regulator [Phenylobacterium sp.]